jgi:hypothetical protein
MWDTVGLLVMRITVSTYTIFIKVRKSYRVLVMFMRFDDVTPFGIITDEITPSVSGRQTYSFRSIQWQLLLLEDSDDYPLMCEASIPLLLFRVRLFLLSWLFLVWCVLHLMWVSTDAQLGQVASFIQLPVGRSDMPLVSRQFGRRGWLHQYPFARALRAVLLARQR